MKEGDLLTWRTLNGWASGKVERDADGTLLARTSPTSAFPLEDLRHVRNLKVEAR